MSPESAASPWPWADLLLACLLSLTVPAAAQAPAAAPPFTLERTRIVALTGGGRAAELELGTALPPGSVVDACLVEEETPPPRSPTESRVRAAGVPGRAATVRLVIALPPDAGPGLYEAVVACEPGRQPRYLAARPAAAVRARVPFVVGTPAEAQDLRDQAVAAGAAAADAVVALAAELGRALATHGAAPEARAAFREWLRERGPRQALAAQEVLAALRDVPATAGATRALRTLAGQVLAALAGTVRARCVELELAVPVAFAGGEGVAASAAEGERLLVAALVARARARRHELAPEPGPVTLERLRRRCAWLLRAGTGAPALVPDDVVAWVLADLCLGLERIRRPATQRDAGSGARLEALASRLAGEVAGPSGAGPRQALAAVAPVVSALRAELAAVAREGGRATLLEDREALVALHDGLAGLGRDAVAWGAWRRQLGVTRALATSPEEAPALVAWLSQAGDLRSEGRALAPDAEARWQAALAALDARLRR